MTPCPQPFGNHLEKQAFFNEELSVHERLVRTVVRRVLSDPHDVEDAVQETMLLAWSSLEQLRNRKAASAWLCAIARNTAADMLARRMKEPFISLNDEHKGSCGHGEGASYAEVIAGKEGCPAEILMERSRIAVINAVFAALPRNYRRQLYLRCVLRLKAAEIDAILDMDESKRKNACSRARRSMRQKLGSLEDRGINQTEPRL
ncbi:MAG TPA: RNA polymerase sigma factor [Bacillota bacterium]|nr:RNA polymerase sigma factor [Bacillota bacterium]